METAVGVDFGTSSVRAIVVDTATGEVLGTAVHPYARGEEGVLLDHRDPNVARQHPAEYAEGFVASVKGAMTFAGVDPATVAGIGIDTTASTPIPVDRHGQPLAFDPAFADHPAAMAWLWKDHSSHAEAEEITQLAREQGRPYLDKCGGTYSSEWFWSKILHCARTAPYVFSAAHSWIECVDWVPAWATGTLERPRRSVCAAGHKAMYHPDWGGLPAADFLAALDANLYGLRTRLYDEAVSSDHAAGHLTAEVADACGLPHAIPVAVGGIDAHFGAVGSGVAPGVLVKIMGTSTCDILVSPTEEGEDLDIRGVSGVVPGSVLPGMQGIEAGQSAVGDLFNWFVRFSGRSHDDLTAEADRLQPGESGLLALDWNNGNRNVLADPLLSGLLVGQSLSTTPGEVYRALIEATAFGALMIVQRLEESGVQIDQVVCCGGIAEKSPTTMQIYADVCNRPMSVSSTPHTCALGAAIFGAVVGGAHREVADAQAGMAPLPSRTYTPDPVRVETYRRLFDLYRKVHDAFGGVRRDADLPSVMKELIAIRDRVRR